MNHHFSIAHFPCTFITCSISCVVVRLPFAETINPAMAETIEVLQRGWHVEGQSIRPDHRMVAHTGFLTHGRLLAPET